MIAMNHCQRVSEEFMAVVIFRTLRSSVGADLNCFPAFRKRLIADLGLRARRCDSDTRIPGVTAFR